MRRKEDDIPVVVTAGHDEHPHAGATGNDAVLEKSDVVGERAAQALLCPQASTSLPATQASNPELRLRVPYANLKILETDPKADSLARPGLPAGTPARRCLQPRAGLCRQTPCLEKSLVLGRGQVDEFGNSAGPRFRTLGRWPSLKLQSSGFGT